MPRILELPPAQRPRERLLAGLAHIMQPAELLALVLGTGRGQGEDALQLAERVVDELDGLEGLASADLDRLQAIVGIGPVKATRIRAAFELALRAGMVEPPIEYAAFEPEPEPEPDPLARTVAELRGCLPVGARAVLAFDPSGAVSLVTLSMGRALDSQARPGAYLAQMLAAGEGPWWVVSVRPDGPPEAAEYTAADRLIQAARLVGVPLEQVLAIGRSTFWPLDLP